MSIAGMRCVFLSSILLIIIFPKISFGQFEPENSEICMNGEVSQRILLRQVLEKNNVFQSNLDPYFDRNVGYTEMATALLSPNEYCGEKEKNCKKGTVNNLGKAQVILLDYLNRHSVPPPAGSAGVVITRVRPSPSPNERGFLFITSKYRTNDLPGIPRPAVPVEEFLETSPPFFKATCVEPAKPTNGTEGGKSDGEAWYKNFAIRAKIEDLKYDQHKNVADFKKLDRAGISINNDLANHSNAFGLQGLVGYNLARAPLNDSVNTFWRATFFGTYTRQYVDGNNPRKSNNVDNIGVGTSGDITFLAGPMYHNLQLYPYFVHSAKSGADVLSASLVYTPMPDWGGIGTIRVIDERLALQLKPQVKTVYGHVFDNGDDPNLSRTNNFGRIGPRLELVAAAWEGTALEGLTLNVAYDYLYGFEGQYDVVRRLEASLNYALPQLDYVGLQLKYIDGRNLDTLEKQRMLTFGVGVKY